MRVRWRRRGEVGREGDQRGGGREKERGDILNILSKQTRNHLVKK